MSSPARRLHRPPNPTDRAIGGRRHEYRPLTSKLVQSTDPGTVAASLLDATGARELYVADLDALGSVQGFTPLAIDGNPVAVKKYEHNHL